MRLQRLISTVGAAILVTVFVAGSASAQSPGMLLGRVVIENDGAPVPGATVTLQRIDSERVMVLLADDHGRFTHVGIRPGFYTVVVEREGFAAVEVRGVEVRSGDRVRLRVEATPAIEAPFARRVVRYRRPMVNVEDATLTTRVL